MQADKAQNELSTELPIVEGEVIHSFSTVGSQLSTHKLELSTDYPQDIIQFRDTKRQELKDLLLTLADIKNDKEMLSNPEVIEFVSLQETQSEKLQFELQEIDRIIAEKKGELEARIVKKKDAMDFTIQNNAEKVLENHTISGVAQKIRQRRTGPEIFAYWNKLLEINKINPDNIFSYNQLLRQVNINKISKNLKSLEKSIIKSICKHIQ